MDRDVLDTIERDINEELRARFPGTAVRQAVLLHYGDDPEFGPVDLWVGPGGPARRGPAGGLRANPGGIPPGLRGGAREHGETTLELTRLGPAGLETLDTLIMAGTAATARRPCGGPWTASASSQRIDGSAKPLCDPAHHFLVIRHVVPGQAADHQIHAAGCQSQRLRAGPAVLDM